MTKKFLGWSSVAASLVVAGVAIAVPQTQAAVTQAAVQTVNLVNATPSANRTNSTPTAGDSVNATNLSTATTVTIDGSGGATSTSKKIGFLYATGDIAISAQNGTTVKIEKFDNSLGVNTGKEPTHGAAIYGEKSVTIGTANSTGTLIFGQNNAVHGGAILVDDSTGSSTNNLITILGGTNTFTANTATGWGGALLADKVIISGGTNSFTGNQAKFGGAISTAWGVDITGGTFTSNKATKDTNTGDGGAINIDNQDSTCRSKVAKAIFTTNEATISGGAIRTGISMDVTDSTFIGNKVKEVGGSPSGGGAIFVSNTASTNAVTLTVDGSKRWTGFPRQKKEGE